MASFLIFIDGHLDSSGHEVLAACGLSSLLQPGEPEPSVAKISGTGGPSGQGGALVLPIVHGDDRDPPMLYKPDSQTWSKFKCGGAPEYWIGWQQDAPPTPRDLARPRMYRGMELSLGAHSWVIPWAFAEQQRYAIGKHGEPCRVREPMCRDLYDLAAPAYERLCGHYAAKLAGEESDWNADSELIAATELLAKNYRLDVSIALALGLFTPSDIAKVIAFATNPEKFAEYQLALGGAA